jgi:hypothetical protein
MKMCINYMGFHLWFDCYDIAVTQINYPSLNKQDIIEQVNDWSHAEDLFQVFMLDDMKLGGGEVI